MMPLTSSRPQRPPKKKEASHNMEIMLATLPIPRKEDLKGKGLASTMAASTQPPNSQDLKG